MKSFRDQLKECQQSGNAYLKQKGNPVVYCKKHYCQCMSTVCRKEREEVDNAKAAD